MKLSKNIISVVLCIFVLSSSILFLVLDKKEFSDNENRMLEKFPDFSFSSLTSGKFTLKLEEYLKDHFPARDELMLIKTKAQISTGFKKINNVYIGKDRLIGNLSDPDTDSFVRSSNKLFSNINEDIRTSVLLIPTAAEIYSEALPAYADVVNENMVITEILSQIDCDIKTDLIFSLNEAKSKGKNLFYRTDHHWTSYGASVAYEAFCKDAGLIPCTDFVITEISDDFKGTLYSKVPDESIKDTIEQFDVNGLEFICRSGVSPEALTECEYYASDYLSKKDKYAYFGNENQPVIVLENIKCKNDNEIVLVKDSFANCFAPFLCSNYKKVHIIDTRYMKKPKVSEYVNTLPNVSDVMILYGIDSLNNNTGISRIS